MVTECVVLGTFRATLHDERAGLEPLLRSRDCIGEGVVVARDLLTVDDEIAVVVTRHKFVLVLEIVLEFFV